MRATFHCFKSLLFIAILCQLSAIPLIGQKIEQYDGPLTIQKYSGNAQYGFKVVSADTILQGDFRFQKSNIDSLLKKQDYAFDIQGRFEDGFPTGLWQFQFGEYQSAKASQVVDYQYRLSVNGKQEEASGRLFRGRPDGNWSYEVNQIDGSQVANTAFKSTISFERGVPQKSFKIENDSISLVGRFLRNGLAHDVWSLYGNTSLGPEESWIFNEGILTRIEFTSEQETKVVPVFNQDAFNNTTIINLNEQFLHLVLAWVAQSEKEALQSANITALLDENMGYYEKIDDILSTLGKASFQPEFKVRIPNFPLDSTEIEAIQKIEEDFIISKAICEKLLNNTQLNILRLSDEDAKSSYRLVSRLYDKYVFPAETLLKYRENHIFEFLPRNKAIGNSWPDGIPSIAGIISSPGQNSVATNKQLGELEKVAQLSKLVRIALKDTEDQLSQQLLKEQQQQDLNAIEKSILDKQRDVKTAVDSLSVSLEIDYSQALKRVSTLTDEKLKAYAKITELEDRLTMAKALDSCFTNLKAITYGVAQLPEEWTSIQQQYTDRVWNPFTATLMDEEIKKRITTTYKRILEPYFLNQLNENFDCDKSHDWLKIVEATQARIQELHEENTKKLERKLRKTKKPAEVLGLLGILNAVTDD